MSDRTESGGKTATAIHQEWLDGMSLKFSCAFCTWSYEGGLTSGRTEAESHRQREHPEIGPYKRKRGSSGLRPQWRRELKDDEREEVEMERRRRAAEIGVKLA